MNRRVFLKSLAAGATVLTVPNIILANKNKVLAAPDSLADIIYHISPTETPFMTLMKKRNKKL